MCIELIKGWIVGIIWEKFLWLLVKIFNCLVVVFCIYLFGWLRKLIKGFIFKVFFFFRDLIVVVIILGFLFVKVL